MKLSIVTEDMIIEKPRRIYKNTPSIRTSKITGYKISMEKNQ